MKLSHNCLIKVILVVTASNFISTYAYAFSDSRSEKWAFFLAPQYTNSKLLQFNNGAEADINERSSIGFGFAYNLNKHIELGGTFASSNSNYTGTAILDDDEDGNPDGSKKFVANMYSSSINFNFTYNFLDTPLTPYITANIGSTYIDSGIPTGEITSGCWWDPWTGLYRCTPVALTYTTTEFNYGAGIGLRYDFNRKVYMKGGVTQNYIDLDSTNTPDFTTYQFIFGFMF